MENINQSVSPAPVLTRQVQLTVSGDQDVSLFLALLLAKKKLTGQLENANDIETVELHHALSNIEVLVKQIAVYLGQDNPDSTTEPH